MPARVLLRASGIFVIPALVAVPIVPHARVAVGWIPGPPAFAGAGRPRYDI
jgi:hypothetical protein